MATVKNPRPEDRSGRAPGLLVHVEESVAAGTFRPDWRLKNVSVTQGLADRGEAGVGTTKAVLALDLSASGPEGTLSRLNWQDALDWLRPDRRVQVWVQAEDGEVILFDGWPMVHTLHWAGQGAQGQERAEVLCESHIARWARHPDAQVYGRYMPKTRGNALEVAHVAATPCWFNREGKGNCCAQLHNRQVRGEPIDAPVFTYDGDPAAKKWSIGDAIRYVVAFYWPDGLELADGNLLEVTENELKDKDGIKRDPNDGLAGWNLRRCLRATCPSLRCDEMSGPAALAMLCRAAEAHLGERYTEDGPRLWLWAKGTGAPEEGTAWTGPYEEPKDLRLEQEGASSAGRPAAEVFADNEVFSGQIAADAGEIVNDATVLGAAKLYELTVELVPGWLPHDGPDHDPDYVQGDEHKIEAAEAAAILPGEEEPESEWLATFAKGGAQFAAHRLIGRLWVLNEAGELGAAYNRQAGPWTSYAAFSFYDECGKNGQKFEPAKDWVKRRRRFLSCISVDKLAAGDEIAPSFGIVVEASFDSGTSWERIAATVRVLEDRCGIYIEEPLLTAVAPAGKQPPEDNLWFALLEGRLRLRVTAAIEADERLATTRTSDKTETSLEQGRLLPNAARFRFRDNTTGNSALATGTAPPAGPNNRNDATAMEAFAKRFVDGAERRRMAAAPVIPWIDWTWRLGDVIRGIWPRGISFAEDRRSRWFPEVVEIEFATEPPVTRLMLEDVRLR